MNKKWVIIIIILLFSIISIGCENQNSINADSRGTVQSETSTTNQSGTDVKKDTQPKNNVVDANKLTIEDIKARYTGGNAGQIVNLTTYVYDAEYALVEYTYGGGGHFFDWYNLKTGSKDTILGPCNAKLVLIKNQNDMLFMTDGVVAVNSHKYFPELIRCYRNEESTGLDGEFEQVWNNLYLPIEQGFDMGVKPNETIADIKVSLEGLTVLFEPMKGNEVEFYAAYTTVPPTKTSYNRSKNQFIIEFEKTDIDNKLDISKVSEQNCYIKSIKIERKGLNTLFTIDLKDIAKYYTIVFSHLNLKSAGEGLPYLDFRFTDEYRIE